MLILLLIGLAAAVIAVGITLLVRYLTKRDTLSIAIGGLAIPALILAGLVYWLATMQADDAPPGMVILGNMQLIAIAAPLGLLASYVTVRTITVWTGHNTQEPPIE